MVLMKIIEQFDQINDVCFINLILANDVNRFRHNCINSNSIQMVLDCSSYATRHMKHNRTIKYTNQIFG